MDSNELAIYILHLMASYEPPEHHMISNYVDPLATNIHAVRIDGEFDLYTLAYNILTAVESD